MNNPIQTKIIQLKNRQVTFALLQTPADSTFLSEKFSMPSLIIAETDTEAPVLPSTPDKETIHPTHSDPIPLEESPMAPFQKPSPDEQRPDVCPHSEPGKLPACLTEAT